MVRSHRISRYRWPAAAAVVALVVLAVALFAAPAAAQTPDVVPADTQHASCAGDSPAGNCPTLTFPGDAPTVATPGEEITVAFSLARGAKGGNRPWQRLTLDTMCDPDYELRDGDGNVVASSESFHLVQTEERAFADWRGDCEYTRTGDAIMTPPARDDSSFDMTDRNPGTAGTQVIGPIIWNSTLTLPEDFSGAWRLSASIDPRLDASGNQFTSLAVANQDLEIRSPDNGGVTLPAKVAGSSAHAFITTWETTSNGESITIPTKSRDYDYTVNWGDGAISYRQSGDATHSYATAGTHRVTITGDFPQIYINAGASATQIRSVEQWGTQAWRSMDSAFQGVTDFEIAASDTPNLENVTSIFRMFQQATAFTGANSRIGDWDVSKVTNMDFVFYGATAFNQDIGDWDTSNVQSASAMFADAAAFNQDIGDWSVSNVTNMEYMFYKAAAFNQDIGDWNVSNVRYMSNLFGDATAFNQDIGDWNVSNMTNMGYMFYGAEAFNQDIGSWNVSNVTDMDSMFYGAEAFNQDIGSWNVSNVTDMESMFHNAAAFNQDISGWNVSAVQIMFGMFVDAVAFNQNIGSWNVSNATNVSSMFYRAAAFDQDLGGWDISNLTSMYDMFTESGLGTANYDATLRGWSTLSQGETRIPRFIHFSAPDTQYSSAGQSARDTLSSLPYNWNFNDGGLADIVRNVDIRIELDIVQAIDISHDVAYGGLVEGDDHRVSTWVKVFHVVPKAIGINPDGDTNPQLGTVLDYTQSDPEGRGKFLAVHENGTTEDLIGNYRSDCWDRGTKNWEEGDALEHDEERLLLQSDSGGCPVYFYATIASGVYTVTLEVPVDRDADGVDDADPAVGTTTLTIVPAALTVEVEFDDSDATVSPVVGQTGFNVIFSDASGGFITDDSFPSLCYGSNCDHKIPSVSAEGGLSPGGPRERSAAQTSAP